MLTYLLTISSLQEVILLKDNKLEDIIGVPCHPDRRVGRLSLAACFFYVDFIGECCSGSADCSGSVDFFTVTLCRLVF